MKVRIGRLVKVLSIFRHAREGTAKSHGFFEGGTELATPVPGELLFRVTTGQCYVLNAQTPG